MCETVRRKSVRKPGTGRPVEQADPKAHAEEVGLFFKWNSKLSSREAAEKRNVSQSYVQKTNKKATFRSFMAHIALYLPECKAKFVGKDALVGTVTKIRLCVYEQLKLSRAPFPISDSKSTAVLDLVHSDLCGPMEEPTPSGNEYVMTMIDDFSKFTVVYLLKHKSEAFEKIRSYVSLVENLFGRKPKILRTDGGGEYSSNRLKQYLSDNGITLQQTAPYSPQQNGKAERANRSLMEMTRCLLLEAKLGKKYWGESVMTACYIYNRLPSAKLNCTPYELWYKKQPKYSHLRVFGSDAWVHVPDEKRRKLDSKAVKLKFVGYAEDRKAYRFLNTETDRILISRNAKFLELEADSQESVREVVKPRAVADLEVSLGNSTVPEAEDAEEEEEQEELNETVCPGEVETSFDSASENEFFGEASLNESLFEGFARRSARSTKGAPPKRLIEEANACLAIEEPRSVQEARKSLKAADWEKAMQEELSSHSANGTWKLTRLPDGRKAIGSKWVSQGEV